MNVMITGGSRRTANSPRSNTRKRSRVVMKAYSHQEKASVEGRLFQSKVRTAIVAQSMITYPQHLNFDS
jgi:hypothetical protein